MKILVAFSLLLAVASAFEQFNENVSERKPYREVLDKVSPTGRITNGRKASRNQFKYQVGLSLTDGNTSSWCGGSLISNEWVLTAGHCADGIVSGTVQLGGNNRLKPQLKYKVSKEDIINHPKFDRDTLKNDIALIRIPAVKYNNSIRNVALPRRRNSYPTYEGDVAVASGWGLTSDESDDTSDLLQYADFRVISNKKCERTFSNINPGIICVASRNSVSTCQGDSGGPLVLKHGNFLIGVTSFVSSKGCELNYPAAFTRVTKYLPWIQKHTGLKL